MSSTFDFIVVGSGPAGSALASLLARSAKAPTVLLLEVGEDHTARQHRVAGQRFTTFTNPDMNMGYKTTPQEHCNGRELSYERGRGIGGSSTINFGIWTVGARDDYDQWAALVQDEAFSWAQMQPRFKALEGFNMDVPEGTPKKFVNPSPSDHGSGGPIKVGFAPAWEKGLLEQQASFEEGGFPINTDHNSGNPIGLSVAVTTVHKGLRTAAGDLLETKPDNLTITTGAFVHRVLFDGKTATGVETTDQKKCVASKEVILCAGALDTPKILMHSGIGPADQLSEFDIPVLHELSSVGKNLMDHAFVTLVHERDEDATDRKSFYGDSKAMQAAQEQWNRDGSGLWAKYGCEHLIGFLKMDSAVSSEEFRALPQKEREFLSRETVPHWEIFTHVPSHFLIPNYPPDKLNYGTMSAFLYNEQSRGEARLQSSDPKVPLLFDPRFLSHPFDRRLCIEALRRLVEFARSPGFAEHTVADSLVPAGDSDDDLLEFWRQNISSAWHTCGTAKMGRVGDPEAVVDSSFRVHGIKGLRVADMSVAPVLVNGHTQCLAYLIGWTCAAKMMEEYGLE